MHTKFIRIALLLSVLLSSAAPAVTGEYWEVTSKMEMAGMPFAMPSNTQKVCVPQGGANDPSKSSGDKDCTVSEMKIAGNKTTWKARCNHDGEVMNGVGEQITSGKSYEGKVQFSGKSQGENMDMKMVYSGKRVGGSCDSAEAMNKLKGQACDKSQYGNTAGWIVRADNMLGKNALCAEQQAELCARAKQDTPKDAEAFSALILHDKQMNSGVSVAQGCKLDMKAITKSVCKTINGKNYSQLAAHCPAEAKRYREEQRRKDCEGRSFTAETRAADIKKCMSGVGDAAVDEPDAGDAPSPQIQRDTEPAGSSAVQNVFDGAKKLKGLFGF
ncbi:MAG: DUF3617 domain-containing protein [Gallionella sp.]